MGTVAEGNLRADYGSNARIKQTLRSSLEPVLVLRQVLVSGPITALAAAAPRRKVNIFWEAPVRPLDVMVP